MTHLDLFTGIGGFHIAAEWAGFETVGFSEVDPYCCKLLAEKWPNIPNYGDLKKADFGELRKRVTVFSAGVPCQPASLAGKRLGARDDRWLWPAVLDVVGSVQPAWCIFENPDGILSLGEFRGILLRLEALGYSIRAFRVPANAVGAKHRRFRVFIVAHADQGNRRERGDGWREEISGRPLHESAGPGYHAEALADAMRTRGREESRSLHENDGQHERRPEAYSNESSCSGQAMADAESGGLRCGRQRSEKELACDSEEHRQFRFTEPPLCRATDGISNRSHRLKALGNAVVPQQAFPFFQAIAEVGPEERNYFKQYDIMRHWLEHATKEQLLATIGDPKIRPAHPEEQT